MDGPQFHVGEEVSWEYTAFNANFNNKVTVETGIVIGLVPPNEEWRASKFWATPPCWKDTATITIVPGCQGPIDEWRYVILHLTKRWITCKAAGHKDTCLSFLYLAGTNPEDRPF